MQKLPIGTQSFSILRNNNYLYVDKTKYIYKMIEDGRVYFLSRPRRFGKSLLITTIKELFEGNKKLFEGLYIHDKWNWEEKYPVIILDFGGGNYKTPNDLENKINNIIHRRAREFEVEIFSNTIDEKFTDLITGVYNKTGEKVVVLVDEYDMHIIDSLNDIEVDKRNRDILNSFYKVLKATDNYLKFIFLTCV